MLGVLHSSYQRIVGQQPGQARRFDDEAPERLYNPASRAFSVSDLRHCCQTCEAAAKGFLRRKGERQKMRASTHLCLLSRMSQSAYIRRFANQLHPRHCLKHEARQIARPSKDYASPCFWEHRAHFDSGRWRRPHGASGPGKRAD